MNHTKKLLIITLATLFNGLWGMKDIELADNGQVVLREYSHRHYGFHAFTTDPQKERTLFVSGSRHKFDCYHVGEIDKKGEYHTLFDVTLNDGANCLVLHNNILAILTHDITLYDLNTQKPIKSFGQGTNYRSGVFCNNGQNLAVGTEGEVQLWDIASSECIKKLEIGSDKGPINFITLSADKKLLFVDSFKLSIWNHETGECLSTLSDESALDTTFHAGTNYLARGVDDPNNPIHLWDIEQKKLIKKLDPNSGWIYSVTFNHDGSILATGSCIGKIILWDTTTGNCLCTIMGQDKGLKDIDELIFSPDDHFIITRSAADTYVWDLSKFWQCIKFAQLLKK